MCSETLKAAFEVRSIQAQSPRAVLAQEKDPHEFWPICQAFLAAKFGK